MDKWEHEQRAGWSKRKALVVGPPNLTLKCHRRNFPAVNRAFPEHCDDDVVICPTTSGTRVMSLHQEITSTEAPWDITGTPDRRWHDAVHEAGRLAIGRTLGLGSGYGDLGPEQEGVDDRGFWRARMIADMAGAEAEREMIGWCIDEDHRALGDFAYSDDGQNAWHGCADLLGNWSGDIEPLFSVLLIN